MEWKSFSINSPVRRCEIPDLAIQDFRGSIVSKINIEGMRVLAFFGAGTGSGTILYSVLGDDSISKLQVASTFFAEGEKSYRSLTPEIPSLHIFEREFYEETGIRPEGHPWLKPVRYAGESHILSSMEEYPFYRMDGDEIHEVAVGPVHAGVIEPGHFRFMCHGEKVYHLEIQLGYQNRGIEKLITDRLNLSSNKRIFFPQLAERIAGDSAVAHASAYAQLVESLTGTDIPHRAMSIRGICLELERAAVHIGDIGAVFNDIGFLMGSSTFGALRTLVINTSLAICGSRFGMGLIRVGGVNYDIDSVLNGIVRENLDLIRSRLQKLIPNTLLDQPSVLSRLEGTGIVDTETARAIGMVGPAARASGVPIDIRIDYPSGIYRHYPARKIILEKGDVFARTYIRYIEAIHSLNYAEEQLKTLQERDICAPVRNDIAAGMLGFSMIEGWRGEIIHAAVTDDSGRIIRYKIKDPSFNNWYGLALAVRDNGVSDFPLCNKSFNLSYCGHDL